jgi:hypothetical protein
MSSSSLARDADDGCPDIAEYVPEGDLVGIVAN